jgi:hypothetical protein
LSVVPDAQWARVQDKFVHESWLREARARARASDAIRARPN